MTQSKLFILNREREKKTYESLTSAGAHLLLSLVDAGDAHVNGLGFRKEQLYKIILRLRDAQYEIKNILADIEQRELVADIRDGGGPKDTG